MNSVSEARDVLKQLCWDDIILCLDIALLHTIVLVLALLKYFPGFMCMSIVSTHMCRRRSWLSWDWHFRQLLTTMWVLETKSRQSARTASASNSWPMVLDHSVPMNNCQVIQKCLLLSNCLLRVNIVASDWEDLVKRRQTFILEDESH